MQKQVAVLAVNPVNGYGLFQYLETFFEHGIKYKVFAVSDSTTIKTNSGIPLQTDDIVSHLKGHADEYDALVFSCGDAVPNLSKNMDKSFNTDLLSVIQEFADQQKLMIGHCAAALIFEIAGVTEGKQLAVHPLAKSAFKKGLPTNAEATVDGNFYTAACEHSIPAFLPKLLETLK